MKKIILNLVKCGIMILASSTTYALQNFQQACKVVGDDYLQYKIEVTDTPMVLGSEFNLKITAFEDQNCQKPYISYNQYFKIKHIVNEKIDLQVQKITYSPLTQETTDALNMMAYCQSKNWKNQQEVNVTGQKCEDYQQLQKNDLFYQLVSMSTSGLLLGDITQANDGRSETHRPVQFDSLIYSQIKLF